MLRKCKPLPLIVVLQVLALQLSAEDRQVQPGQIANTFPCQSRTL